MKITIRNGKTVVELDVSELRCLAKARDIAKALGKHGGGAVCEQFATNIELGVDELLIVFGEPPAPESKPSKPA